MYCLSSELDTNSYEIVPIQVNKFISASDIQEKIDFKKQMSLKKESGQKKLRARDKLDFRKIDCLKNKSGWMKLTLRDKLDLRRKNLIKGKSNQMKLTVQDKLDFREIDFIKKKKRSEQTKKESTPDRVSQHKISQQEYLNTFDITQNGGIEEQSWAKANINKFHKSVQYTVSQCTVCKEAWPLKSKPRVPYVCSRCVRDNKSPRKFSYENSMIPSSVPNELQNLTQIEEMLIACALSLSCEFTLNLVVNKAFQGIVLTCHKMSQNLRHLCQGTLKTWLSLLSKLKVKKILLEM